MDRTAKEGFFAKLKGEKEWASRVDHISFNAVLGGCLPQMVGKRTYLGITGKKHVIGNNARGSQEGPGPTKDPSKLSRTPEKTRKGLIGKMNSIPCPNDYGLNGWIKTHQ